MSTDGPCYAPQLGLDLTATGTDPQGHTLAGSASLSCTAQDMIMICNPT